MVREGIKNFLNRQDDLEVIAEVEDIQQLFSLLSRVTPDLVLLDYKLRQGDTFGVPEQLKNFNEQIKVLLLTGYCSSAALQKLSQSRIDGLVLKQAPLEELHAAIQEIQQGRVYISPMVDEYIEPHQSVNLTGRELQILNMIVMGLSRSQIAEQLEVAAETIKSHRKNLMKKMEVRTVTELIVKAQELKLLEYH